MSTLSELLQIGDQVVFEVDQERRNWTGTYRDVPDGIRGVVCGFSDAVIYEPRIPVYVTPPGVYHRRGACSVWLPDGRIVPGDYVVSMIDKEEEKRRDAALRDQRGALRQPMTRLGELPETKFWEQDRVRVRFPRETLVNAMTVSVINYTFLHERRKDGSPYPFYQVMYSGGSWTSAEESWMELIERGNLWKHYHGEPLVFASLAEEAKFFTAIGEAEEVVNPATNLYDWTIAEVLDAIRRGEVHGFETSSTPFGTGALRLVAWRFKNEELGARVAKKVLEGFAA